MLNETKPLTVKEICLNNIVKGELGYLSLLAEKKRVEIRVEQSHQIYFKIDEESFRRLVIPKKRPIGYL